MANKGNITNDDGQARSGGGGGEGGRGMEREVATGSSYAVSLFN